MSSVREWGDCEHGIRIHKCPECALSELTTLRARIAELERENTQLKAAIGSAWKAVVARETSSTT